MGAVREPPRGSPWRRLVRRREANPQVRPLSFPGTFIASLFNRSLWPVTSPWQKDTAQLTEQLVSKSVVQAGKWMDLSTTVFVDLARRYVLPEDDAHKKQRHVDETRGECWS